jgi:hypothetical protein
MQWLNVLWNPLALFYQGQRDLVERALTAAGLTILVGNLLQSGPSYAPEWVVVLIVALFAIGLYHRTAGYVAAVAIAVWPLWQLSPYLATLFLAVAVLGREWLVNNLEWTILIVAAPLLAPYSITALVPLLAGLFLGAAGGFWVGLLLALWLKLVGGMAGIEPDMLSLHQEMILIQDIATRYSGANSLETLRLLVAPFAGNATFLLLDLLQLLLWALGGYLVGWMRRLSWAEREPWVSLIPALLLGGLSLWAAIFLIPIWLELAPVGLLWSDPIVVAGLVISVASAAGLYFLRYSLRRPVRRVRWHTSPTTQHQWPEPSQAAHSPSAKPTAPRRTGTTPRPAASGDDGPVGDVIMLELD